MTGCPSGIGEVFQTFLVSMGIQAAPFEESGRENRPSHLQPEGAAFSRGAPV